MKFYVCPICGNVVVATEENMVTCCGEKLNGQEVKSAEGKHRLLVEEKENQIHLTSEHGMTKEHHLNFIAYGKENQYVIVKLSKEVPVDVTLEKQENAEIIFGCNQHGVWRNE
ncbi:MAG: hypothetical protein K2I72_00765 [Bacilli bacterium]|nr:hypothetical protein [Bacilli bacterium]